MRLEMISAYYATCAAQETAKPTCDVGWLLPLQRRPDESRRNWKL
jgi:hypothetical protein